MSDDARKRLLEYSQNISSSTQTTLVRLKQPFQLTLLPGQKIELHGCVPGVSNANLIPRSSDQLPRHLRVISSEIKSEGGDFALVLQNEGTRSCITLTHATVLAEISLVSPVMSSGLVGPSCESPVFVNGVSAKCLIDSGSQVSIISESFYREKLSDLPLEPLDSLKVTGAGGQTVPYLGFVRCEIGLPVHVVGVKENVSSLLLVCPDTDFSKRVPIIVGTNVLRLCAEVCKVKGGVDFSSTLQIRPEVLFVYNDLPKDSDGFLGSAQLVGPSVVIPAGEVKEVRCCSRVSVPGTRTAVLIQEPSKQQLPEGLEVIAGKIAAHSLKNAKICIRNKSSEDIVLNKKQVVGDIFVYECEYVIDDVVSSLGDEKPAPSSQNEPVFVHSHTASESESNIEFNIGDGVPEDWKNSFLGKLQSYSDVFIKSEFDVGKLNTDFQFDIEVEPGPQIKQRARPISQRDFEDLRSHIQGLLDAQIIRPSHSPYASPIVLCRKKTGALRMCCDYRMLNSRTIRDAYSLPKIEDLLLTLSGAKYFASMDLCKAYYQVPMSERASKLSAFTTVFGNFEWARLAQGLANAPACFQRLMETVFRDMNLVELIIFLDDLLVHGQTLDELEERTLKVLGRLRQFNLKLDPTKCVFGVTEIKHLGYVISKGCIRPDPDKVSAVKNWPKPETVKDIKRIVGFANFYRRFIPNFSQMIKPLNDMTVGYAPQRRDKPTGKKKRSKDSVLTLSSDITHLWGEEQDQAFENVKSALTSDLVLGLADKSKTFYLHCDACGYGLGAVLYQEFDGVMRVISYGSRGLNKSEQNYPTHKREFLALKWAMTDKFHDYLYGSHSVVVTDNNPLCYVLKNAKLDATSHRWLTSLSLYDFELRYKKGSSHIDADSLSRIPQRSGEEDSEYQKSMEKISFLLEKAKVLEEDVEKGGDISSVNCEGVQAILNAHCVNYHVRCNQHTVNGPKDSINCNQISDSDNFVPAVEQLVKDPSLISEDLFEPDFGELSAISQSDWRKFQLADRRLKVIIEKVEANERLVAAELEDHELKAFAREQSKLEMKGGVLYRKVENEGETFRWQLVLPVSHRKEALKGVHEDLFHTHFDNAISQLRMRFFWPFMSRELEKKIKRCMRCIKRGAVQQKAPMNSIVTTFPLELLSIDYLTIDIGGKKQSVLVVVDHFTKFGAAYCTKDQTAKTVVKTLWKEFFMVYGFPKKILSDQGRDFESEVVHELCKMAGIQKIRTTPYHPCSNPVERWNRTLLNMLRSLEEERKVEWKKVLPCVVHAYNCCQHQSTGFSPYFLFFGRHPRLPVDIAFGIDLNQGEKKSVKQHVRGLREQLKSAYEKAEENMQKMAKKNKLRYDISAHAAELECGDRVLVRKLGHRVDSKLSDKWERDVYVITAKMPDLPVYTVQRESGDGEKRTLHRNYLLPIGVLGEELSSDEPKKRLRAQKKPQGGIAIRRSVSVEAEKDVGVLDTVSDSEEEVSQIEIELSAPPPNHNLRADAPTFVPAGSRQEKAEEEVPQVQQDISNASVHEESEDMGDEISSDQSDSEGASIDDVVTKDERTSIPRRSGRVRRPVDRLNLVHQVVSKDFEDCRQSRVDFVTRVLHTRLKLAKLLSLNSTPVSQYIRFMLWAASVKDVWMLRCFETF